MANTLTWGIVALDCKPTVETMTDYVITAHWNLSGTDGAMPPNTGYVYGTVSFEVDPTKSNYVPYADLTEAQVIAWVQGSMGEELVTAYEANVDSQIENMKNPPVVQPPLPWAQSATPSA